MKRLACNFVIVWLIISSTSFGRAATQNKTPSIEASGDALIFDLPAASTSDSLDVCTKAKKSGERWRVTIAQVNTGGAVSSIGSGSTTAYTGCASQSAVSGSKYEVIVTYEGPLPGTFPASVDIKFASAAYTSIPDPRPISFVEGQGCREGENINCGTLVSCAINPAGDTDLFKFIAPNGAVASISIGDIGFRAGAPCWELRNQNATPIASACDDHVEVGPLDAGQYTILTSWDPGPFVNTGSYGLSLQGVSQSFRCGIPITFGETKSGSIDVAGDTDTFNFDALLNQVVVISIVDVDSRAGSPCWELFDPDGMLVTSSCTSTQSDPLAQTGTYTIKVWWSEGAFVNTGPYSISLQKVGGPD